MKNPTHPSSSPPEPQPPRWADRLLERFVAPHLLEYVQGDLHEIFLKQVRQAGVSRARREYVWAVLQCFTPFFARRTPAQYPKPTHTDMMRNYFTVAWRNFTRHKAYSAINVFGLTLGLTCAIVIFTLIHYHLSMDTFHADSDRIYRFVTEQHRESVSYTASVPSPLGKVFRNDYPFGEKVARIITSDAILITIQDGSQVKKFKEAEGVAFTEPEFFDIFHYPLLTGDKHSVLQEPNTAIITEQTARKYFGGESPLDKTFRLDNKSEFRITGILKDLPANTFQGTQIYVSYSSLGQYNQWLASEEAWGGISSGTECFVRLRPGVKAEQVEAILPAYVKKYRPNHKNVHHYKLQPLADIHFNPLYGGTIARSNLWVLGVIALFLVGTACINFVNLATAQALNRAKEVGVRKALGSSRKQLFWQFMAETGLITLVATVLASGSTKLLIPLLNEWFGLQLVIDFSTSGPLAWFIPLAALLVTLLAGAYPGLILARFQPVTALKGKLSAQHVGGFPVRKTLIAGQLALSQMLVIGMIVIISQMRYATQSDLGFKQEAVVMLPLASGSDVLAMNSLKERLGQLSGVEQVSLCAAAPASDNNWTTHLRYDNREEDEGFGVSVRSADHHYIPLFGLELVAGRNLLPSDSVKEFIVNETFVRKLNLPAPGQVLGRMLSMNGGEKKGPIVGVVKDFHDRSFHEVINPVCITSYSDQYSSYAVRIRGGRVNTTLAALEKVWLGMHPDQLFEYEFLDQQLARFYQAEARMLRLIETFTLIAILIGCLGLYGLVSFMAAQKTKEIGIRKVLGSSTSQILWIFAREFFLLTLIGFLIAVPVASFVMNQWLSGFAFKISLGLEVYLSAIMGTLLVVFATIGYRSVKAALMNPVKSLRSE